MIRRSTRALARMLRRAFEGAGGGPRWPLGASMYAPARQALAARHQLANRANFLVANSPSAEAIASVYVTNLIGDGPSVRSQHPNRAMRRALESAWRRFYSRADVTGGGDLGDFLARAVRSLIVAGEAVIHMVTTTRGKLRLRLLSPEQLDASLNRDNLAGGNRIVAGVEFDVSGRVVAYHILPEAPDLLVTMLGPPVRIPAEDVLHIFEAKTPGQVRGVSWLAPVATRLLELDRLEDALMARMNVAACFAGFVTDPEGTAFGDASPKIGDRSELSLEPGVMRILPPGAAINFPNMPGTEGAPELLKHLLRSISAGVGVPYELLSGDLSEVNYSSSRFGLEQFKRRCRSIRANLLVARLLDPLWQRCVTLEILSGRLQAPDFEQSPDDYFAASFLFPEWASLDPLRETNAEVAALGAGLRSRQEIIAARGRDIDDVDAEIVADTFVPQINPSAAAGALANMEP